MVKDLPDRIDLLGEKEIDGFINENNNQLNP